MMNAKNTGVGKSAPLDTDEYVCITLTAENGSVVQASFAAEGCAYLHACAETLCAVLIDKPVVDILQMTNMAIVYNMDTDLPAHYFYCSHMAALAAKNAAKDYLRKNGIEFEDTGCRCGS